METNMEYDIIFVIGERFFDHPLCGPAILKRLLENRGYTVGLIEMPQNEDDIKILGKPKLFFGVSSGSIDSMVRNYTPLKKSRSEDENLDYTESVPDRAVIVFCNWIRKNFKESIMVLGGTEATLRRFEHFDYWDNKLRKPILFDSRADIIAYGSAEKQILEIADRIKNSKPLQGMEGTCIISKELPSDFIELPSCQEVEESKEKFCDMQLLLTNTKNLAQKNANRWILQYKMPNYTGKDLDEYYELPFTRQIPVRHLRGFEFSIVTHRGCIGKCNFCSLSLTQGDRIISRSEESIIREVKGMMNLPHFRGNVDDFGGPSANMYGMDCRDCDSGVCLSCPKLNRTNTRLINLLRKVREIPGIKHVYIRSGIRYDLSSDEYIKELAENHVFDTLKIAPEHIDPEVLRLMNKNKGNLKDFVAKFDKVKGGKELSYYFMTAHPGSSMKEAEVLASELKKLKNTETVQVFTPTPMTISTCMYYTGMDPKTKKKIYVPYTYSEKKEQKRVLMEYRQENTDEY
jgi:uncharacterized radical SAM protein YgiQ